VVIILTFLSVAIVGLVIRLAYNRHKQRVAADAVFCQRLLDGEITTSPPAGTILQAGERVALALPAALHKEQVTGWHGSSNRVSVWSGRIGVGVGSYRGNLERDSVKVAAGHILVTNQRVVFMGDKSSFAIPYAKLVNYTCDDVEARMYLNTASTSHCVGLSSWRMVRAVNYAITAINSAEDTPLKVALMEHAG
jgi:hypothetical protein